MNCLHKFGLESENRVLSGGWRLGVLCHEALSNGLWIVYALCVGRIGHVLAHQHAIDFKPEWHLCTQIRDSTCPLQQLKLGVALRLGLAGELDAVHNRGYVAVLAWPHAWAPLAAAAAVVSNLLQASMHRASASGPYPASMQPPFSPRQQLYQTPCSSSCRVM